MSSEMCKQELFVQVILHLAFFPFSIAIFFYFNFVIYTLLVSFQTLYSCPPPEPIQKIF
jgi:hypothetical protein